MRKTHGHRSMGFAHRAVSFPPLPLARIRFPTSLDGENARVRGSMPGSASCAPAAQRTRAAARRSGENGARPALTAPILSGAPRASPSARSRSSCHCVAESGVVPVPPPDTCCAAVRAAKNSAGSSWISSMSCGLSRCTKPAVGGAGVDDGEA